MRKFGISAALPLGVWVLLSGCATTHIQNKVCISKFINTSPVAITLTLEDGSAVKVPAGQTFECGSK